MPNYIKKEEVNYPYLDKPVSIYTYSSGHKIAIAKKDSHMANISTWAKTGSINENSENNGVSHFLEHLMFKGTTKYKAGVFDRTLESKGGIINAATWKDYTYYYVTIPKRAFDTAIKMHADMMVDPIIPEEEVGPAFKFGEEIPEQKRERYVVIEEIRMGKDNNWRKVYSALNNAMYEKHPYKREVIGSEEIIGSIPRDEIMRYYQTFYSPYNLTTIVVGDFEDDEILEKLENEFKFKDNPGIEKCKSDERIPEIIIKNPTDIELRGDVNTGYLMLGFLCDSAKNLKETIALDIISIILGEGKSSRLYSRFIENPSEPYVYQIETCHYQFKDGDNFFIEATFDPAKKDALMTELKEELDKLAQISSEELNKAKKRARVNFAQEAETVSDIADSIGYYMTVCEDLNPASKYLDTLNEIDTLYISQTAQKYLNRNVCSSCTLMPQGDR